MKILILCLVSSATISAFAGTSVEYSNLRRCALGLGMANPFSDSVTFHGPEKQKPRITYVFNSNEAHSVVPPKGSENWRVSDDDFDPVENSYYGIDKGRFKGLVTQLDAGDAAQMLADNAKGDVDYLTGSSHVDFQMSYIADQSFSRGHLNGSFVEKTYAELDETKKDLEGCSHIANENLKDLAKRQKKAVEDQMTQLMPYKTALESLKKCEIEATKELPSTNSVR